MTTTTENNAISYISTDSPIVDAYFKFVRNIDEDTVYQHLDKCWEYSPILTMKLIFQTRDILKGKGERRIFLICMHWLINTHPDFFKKTFHLSMVYGRCDDIYRPALDTDMEKEVIEFISKQLMEDLSNMELNKSISLMAKWIPSENANKSFYRKLAYELGLKTSEFRKNIVSPLRQYLNIIESKLSQQRYQDLTVDYLSKVPSIAMKRLRKALKKHSPFWDDYMEAIKSGEKKVNYKALMPHDLVKVALEEDNIVIEEQWKALINSLREMGSLENTVVMSDTSGSMHGDNAILVSLALGVLISKLTNEQWQDHVITFDSNPRYIRIPDCEEVGLHKTLEFLMDSYKFPWGGSTDISKAFKEILKISKLSKVPKDQMPKRFIIISDMQFDSVGPKTNFEDIKSKFEKAGYDMPQIVFWNVRANTHDFPVKTDENNVMLISGFSPTILKSVLEATEINPGKLVSDVLNSPRYDLVSLALLE